MEQRPWEFPIALGVTKGTSRDTLLAPYNDLRAIDRVLAENENEICAIIVEPVAGNMGCVLPNDDFLKDLERRCDAHQILLIFDEVMTGFRLSAGGAQELLGVKPDLTTFGKIIGGGLPVGAYGGSREIMNQIAPEGPDLSSGYVVWESCSDGRRNGHFEEIARTPRNLQTS